MPRRTSRTIRIDRDLLQFARDWLAYLTVPRAPLGSMPGLIEECPSVVAALDQTIAGTPVACPQVLHYQPFEVATLLAALNPQSEPHSEKEETP